MSSVKVAVRVRPFASRENNRRCKCIIGMHGATTSEFYFIRLLNQILISTIDLIFGVVEQVKRRTLLLYSLYALHVNEYFPICREYVKMNLS